MGDWETFSMFCRERGIVSMADLIAYAERSAAEWRERAERADAWARRMRESLRVSIVAVVFGGLYVVPCGVLLGPWWAVCMAVIACWHAQHAAWTHDLMIRNQSEAAQCRKHEATMRSVRDDLTVVTESAKGAA